MRKENPSPDFIALERDVMKFWDENQCFEKLVKQNENGERFRFLDGPITANNAMGIHHAWGRTLKDCFIRYNAMHGKSCQYQNGFDAQGLWVEVEAEKEIGIKDKRGIMEYGMDNFTEKCMERVRKYSGVITEQSKRLGQWMDWDHSYFTNTDLNITSIWHFLKVCHDRGLLVKSHRPMPWCPRCGTSLSEHEMSGSYSEVTHTSIYGKLPLVDGSAKMLLWTTTPWTLTSNVALAVNPDMDYVKVQVKSDELPVILIKDAIKKLKGDIVAVLEEFKGSALVGKEYVTVFPEFDCQKFPHRIVPWEDVDATEGVGVVHIAPGCGAEDFDLGKRENLPAVCPIDDSGIILPGFGELSGKATGEALDIVVRIMTERNTLYRTEPITHSYPHCWRCKHDVVFKLVDEWSIATESLKPALIAAARSVKWEPDYAGKRMEDWLTNMGDWNISRKRFYGLPLPFYPCKKCGHLTVIGSKEELIELSENHSLEGVPHLHRPYIDKIKIRCPHCGELVERIPEVGDCWLDAGITPFSTKKYFSDPEYFKKNFPSELVIEMKEQIRLWFYSQLFMSVVLTGKAPYERVVTHSSVVQEDGSKFHKSGFMIKFDEAAEKMGADPVRYLYCAAPYTGDVRFGYNLTDETRRKILSFWNIYVFFNLYAGLDNPDVENFKPDFATFTNSDKWLVARTNKFIETATAGMESFRTSVVTKEFESFCDDVSNWYVRINRKRFWKSVDKNDQMNAYWCLYNAIKATLGIMAPIIPFLTEHIYQNTVRALEKNAPVSVHLTKYPTKIACPDFGEILNETEAAREVIACGQRMRNAVQLKVKQPLRALFIQTSAEYKKIVEPLISVVRDELNVKEVLFSEAGEEFNEAYFTVNFRIAGQQLKKDAQTLKGLVDGLDGEGMRSLAAMVAAGSVDIGSFTGLGAELFDKHDRPKAGYVVESEQKFTLALDTTLDPELIKEGFVRELVRKIQVMRKEAGYAVEQRIYAEISSDDADANAAVAAYAEKIRSDILAVALGPVENADAEDKAEIGEYTVTVRIKAENK